MYTEKEKRINPCHLTVHGQKIHREPALHELTIVGGVCLLCEQTLRWASSARRMEIWRSNREFDDLFERTCGRCGRREDVTYVRPIPRERVADGVLEVVFVCGDCTLPVETK